MIEPPSIAEVEEADVATVRLTIPRVEMPRVFGPAVAELLSTLRGQGIQPSGAVVAHHLRIVPEIWDFEVVVPVPRAVESQGRVRPGRLPAATVARTVYHGPYEGLAGAWGELEAWIVAKGRRPGQSLREAYLIGPADSPDPSAWRTGLVRPLLD